MYMYTYIYLSIYIYIYIYILAGIGWAVGGVPDLSTMSRMVPFPPEYHARPYGIPKLIPRLDIRV